MSSEAGNISMVKESISSLGYLFSCLTTLTGERTPPSLLPPEGKQFQFFQSVLTYKMFKILTDISALSLDLVQYSQCCTKEPENGCNIPDISTCIISTCIILLYYINLIVSTCIILISELIEE